MGMGEKGSVLIAVLVCLACFTAGGAAVHRYHVLKNAEQENARREVQLLKERAAREEEKRTTTNVIGALNESRKRLAETEAAAAAARSDLDRLRDTTADIRRDLPTVSLDACRKRVETLTTIFDQCAARYSEMAETAGRHADDSMTLQEAWPK